MSIDFKGQQCVVCKAYLFEEDDVVFCPVCGAPHHRECYEKIGHCALEEFHGTELEYSKVKAQEKVQEPKVNEKTEKTTETVICPFCYNEFPLEQKVCTNCGRPNTAVNFGGVVFDPMGNVPADFKLDEGVTAKEAAKFVRSSSNRYLPKFAKFSAGGKISWNWAAFLLPEGWALHRKMTKLGIISIALMVIAGLCSMPFYSQLVEATGGYTELLNIWLGAAQSVKVLSLVAVGLELTMRFFLALFGDYIYYNHTVSKIKEIKEENAGNADEQFAAKGGSNLILLVVGILATNYLPTILMYIANLF